MTDHVLLSSYGGGIMQCREFSQDFGGILKMAKNMPPRLQSPSFQEIEALKIEDRYPAETREKIAKLAGVDDDIEKGKFVERCLGFAWQLCHDLEEDKMPDESYQKSSLKRLSTSLKDALSIFASLDEIAHERLEVTAAYKKAMQETPEESRNHIWSNEIMLKNDRGIIIGTHDGFPPSDFNDIGYDRLKAIFSSKWHKTAQGVTHINKGLLIPHAISAIQNMASWAEIAAETTPVKRGRRPKTSAKRAVKNLTSLWELYRKATISRNTEQNTKESDYIKFLEIILNPVLPEDLKGRNSIASMASEIVYPRKGTRKKA